MKELPKHVSVTFTSTRIDTFDVIVTLRVTWNPNPVHVNPYHAPTEGKHDWIKPQWRYISHSAVR